LNNARKRYLHPAAAALGTPVGGWHDFRHALVHTLRKDGVHPKVISKVVGHKTEGLASRVYDHAEQAEIRDALGVMGRRLEPNVEPNRSVN
jgi:integrase